ncbi:MAG: dTMP kinase [Myxococcota bacterium]|nr:dTMP kinase [Myxococcota bacterium]
MSSEQSRFIVIEGLDGAGTTTQAHKLSDWLTSHGYKTHVTAEPTDGRIGRIIRQILRGEFLGIDEKTMPPESIAGLFLADRADHINGEIMPLLKQGVFVICDRYLMSSLAYQGIECGIEWVASVNSTMMTPGLTLMVEVEADIAAKRRAARNDEAELYEMTEFQRQVALGYQQAALLRPNDNIVTIDGSRSISAVFDDITNVVARTYQITHESNPN